METPRFFASLFLFLGQSVAPALDTSMVRDSGPLSPEEERKGFTLPPGFEIRLFAAEPMIDKPINIAFDPRGRLWVTSNHEYPYAAPRERWGDPEGRNVKDSRDAVIILEDTDKDGRADKRTVFANGLNIPTGVLPYKTGCIVWSIPNIWFLDDTDGNGVCDKREILFGPLGWEKDVHGNVSSLRLAPDGWIYATHGYNNTSHFKVRPENLKGAKPGDPGTELSLNSGNVFRFLPDGSRVELHSAGQVNPFGLAWDPHGNLYSADCHSAPIYQLLPGAMYPSFTKPDFGLGFAPVMMQHTHSSTGICGIHYLDRTMWGEAWQDQILIGNIVTSRINRDSVSFRGSTPVAKEEPDFLTSEDPWFRPVDLRFGPDQALWVADFYNKIIGHYEVPLEHPGRDRERGRIWRIVKTDGVPKVEKGPPDPIATLRFAARSGPLSAADLEQVRAWLKSANPFEKRVAAEALLRPVSTDWLPDLLAALASTPPEDEALAYQLKVVIRKHLELPGAFAKVKAVAGMEDLLAYIARSLSSVEAAEYLLTYLRSHQTSPEEAVKSLSRLAILLPAGDLADFAKERFPKDPGIQADLLAAIVDGVQQRGSLPGPELSSWGVSIAASLLGDAGGDKKPAWAAVIDPRSPGLPWAIQTRSTKEGSPIQLISSLDRGGPEEESRTGTLRSPVFTAPANFSFLLCGHNGPPDEAAHSGNFVRLVDDATGAEILRALPPRNDVASRVNWDLSAHQGKPVRFEIADGEEGDAYAWLAAGGFEPPLLSVDSFDVGKDRSVRLGRLASFLKYAAPVGLRDQLADYMPPPPPAPPSTVTPEMRAEIDRVIKQRVATFQAGTADKARGAGIFAANCAICHAIGGKGSLIAPQLDGIGNRGPERLSEDILDPNRNVDSHFRSHVITNKDGSSAFGLERGRLGELLVIIDPAGKEQRLPIAGIATNEETGMSLMPPTFQALPEKDYHDLLAWLLEFK
ncbi:PVC-type heme-binding CxxCH protein [Luteolibacter sp. Populi]|uniref:PVC-type heme-binding CxxCH protein n=1 Tax=Luteolibacter sp. Populi TaxID=3230487 RepID=UPI003467550E